MKTIQRRIILVLCVVALVTPVGIYLPEIFKAEDAWGEWSPETVKQKLGFVPKGMENNASLWKAPLPDYNNGNERNDMRQKSVYYVLSGFIGVGIIALITIGLYFLQRKRSARYDSKAS
jgi:hypothetical protein